MASKTTGGWSAKLRTDNLPLAVALQGLALFVLAFLLSTPPKHHDAEGMSADVGRLLADPSNRVISETEVPADLHPEQVQLPRFPDPNQLRLRQSAPPVEHNEATSDTTTTLNALRINTVSHQAPSVAEVALALPVTPDRLAPGSISQRRFGAGSGRSGWTGRRGGIGGMGGRGDGPRCHPRRPGVLRNPRNPITDPPPTTERAVGHLR